jgi:carbamoyl-phosphate synthase large subunit
VITLLLLSGGGHTGRNVLETLAARREGLRLVATGNDAAEPTLFAFDAAYLTPTLKQDPAGFETRFRQLLDSERPDLVIPCRDEDVAWLAAFGQRSPGHAARLLCGAADVAAMAEDKWLSYQFCTRHGLPFAPTLTGGPGPVSTERIRQFVAEQGLPLIAKPRRGAEGRGVTLVHNLQQALRATGGERVLQRFLGPPDTIQQFLATMAEQGIPLFHSFEGIKRSLQILLGPTGALHGLFCTRHEITGRNTRTVSVDADPEAHDLARRCAGVLASAGWRGPMNIQCQPDRDGRLMIHEFNARFTGATAARLRLAHDELGIALAAFLGTPIGSTPFPAAGQVASEALHARAADPGQVLSLARHGEWQRTPR